MQAVFSRKSITGMAPQHADELSTQTSGIRSLQLAVVSLRLLIFQRRGSMLDALCSATSPTRTLPRE